ncbi:MAG: hypothetical protein DRO01_00375 [Thermoproteota archaeon]|nr:MAG: hypothetical protein DRO01_00375 [Candidatus Korarchaeota archaeon]
MNKLQKICAFLLGLAFVISLTLNIVFVRYPKARDSVPSIRLSKKISGNELANLLSEKFPDANILVMDGWYYLINKEDFDKLLVYDKTDRHEYIPEVYDCDDFAFDLWRNISRLYHIAIGVVFIYFDSIGHAINCYVDTDLNVHLIEPQSDEYIHYSSVNRIII